LEKPAWKLFNCHANTRWKTHSSQLRFPAELSFLLGTEPLSRPADNHQLLVATVVDLMQSRKLNIGL